MLEHLRQQARRLKKLTFAVYLAWRDPRTPWYARLAAVIVTAYAFSPIDLIPDFIPVIGYLDDLILVPLGLFITIRLIPRDVFADCQRQAEEMLANDSGKPINRRAAGVIIAIWIVVALAIIFIVLRK